MELKLGEKIRQRRKQMGFTLKELAGEKVTAAQISAIEKGKCKPSPGLLEFIAEKLEVDVEFFTLSDQERTRRNFEELKEKCQELFKEGKLDLAGNQINKANEMLPFLLDNQKGYFYYLKGNCFYETGQYVEAFDMFVKALTYYLKSRELNTVADIYIKIGNCLFNTHKEDMALGYYLNAYNYINEGLDKDITARILYNLALCYITLKRYNLSKEYLDQCTELIENNDWNKKDRLIPGIEMMRGLLEREVNKNKQSLEKFDDAFEKYKLEGDVIGMGRAKNNSALCSWDLGDMDGAVKYLKEAIDYQIIGDDETLVNTYLNLIEVYEEMNDMEKIFEVINVAEEKMLNNNDIKGSIKIFLAKFDYYKKTKEYDRAEIYAFLALDYIQKIGDKKAESNLYIKLSEMYKETGDEKNSIDYVVKAKSLMV